MKEKYIISETAEHQIKVLHELEKLGYKWRTKEKPTERVPLEISDYHVIYMNLKKKKLSYSTMGHLEVTKTNEKEITYDELVELNKN